MPVTSGLVSFSQEERSLRQFLEACPDRSLPAASYEIISFAQRIKPVDLLEILAEIVPSDFPHFYWENCHKQEGILGYGATKILTTNSGDRFKDARSFIEKSIRKIIRIGDFNTPEYSPQFFCNFTFFSTPENKNSFCFPSATIFLPRWQILKRQSEYFLIVNSVIDREFDLQLFVSQTIRQAQAVEKAGLKATKENDIASQKLACHLHAHTSNRFKSAVFSALQSIQKEHLSKIVLADILDAISLVPFRVAASLKNLRQHYPNCYTFSTSNGQGNYFIGASPERLISLKNQQLVTDALAGSVPRGKTAAEDKRLANQLLSSEKERREHQAVIEFIINRLQQLGLSPHCSPLKILKLSNIQHLWTPIYAQLPAHIHPLDIVSQLHPTPAVAGVPPDIACEEICRYETFDRSLYAAPLGWVDSEGNGEFIVGIRSALIAGNRARLYAGAGIVAGSDPDKEFAEIQLKFQTLLTALL